MSSSDVSGESRLDPDLTVPRNRRVGARLCPACCREGVPGLAPVDADGELLCQLHDLAFVDAQDWFDDPEDRWLGANVADRYRIIGRVGRGSSAKVYRARQLAVGRDVALKLIDSTSELEPDARRRFAREAQATSRLVSPNTVTVFDAGETPEGALFLAMELLDGETLGARLRREGRLSIAQSLEIADGVLGSLAEAHAQGVIHRDLKPDNIFLLAPRLGDGATLSCKVLDFGIAKLLEPAQHMDALTTQAGAVFGTPRYMSPEQAQGKSLDSRSDLYSLGVVLFHMLTGQPPFTDADAVVVMARHIRDSVPRLRTLSTSPAVSSELEDWLAALLAKSPEARPASAEQLRRSLAELRLARDWPEPAAVEPAAAEPSLAGSRKRRVVALLVVTASSVLVGGLVRHGLGGTPTSVVVLAPPLAASVASPAALSGPVASALSSAFSSVPAGGSLTAEVPVRPRAARPRATAGSGVGGSSLAPAPPRRASGDRYGRFE